MLSVYRATDLMFAGEDEVEDARSFSKKLLHKTLQIASLNQFNFDSAIPNFHATVNLLSPIMHMFEIQHDQVQPIKYKHLI